MKLKQQNIIEDNIITVKFTISELGSATSEPEEELNLLKNYPKVIEYSKINFKGNMKITNGIPVITEEEVNEGTVAEVAILGLINKKFLLDENLDISFSIDTSKIADSELSTVFDSKEKLGEAKAALFAARVKEAISKKIEEVRTLSSSSFEGEEEFIL